MATNKTSSATNKVTKPRKGAPKRRNRATALGDALGGALDPVFKKRGFASQSLVTHWEVIAPAPYNTVSIPDQLKWPRSTSSPDGATLYLRCSQGHALMLSHEGAKIAQAVNQYFGYYLVGSVKLSVAPFIPHSAKKKHTPSVPSPEVIQKVDTALQDVTDEELKQSLRQLGLQMLQKKKNAS